MNNQQLEYIIAVDQYRHFAKAAEKCFVTQPTLSMMIQKLEEELGVKIFDRSKQPVIPTETGKAIIAQAKIILLESGKMKELVNEFKNEMEGELHLGIIPTLAPYLLPLFLNDFTKKYPNIKIRISELTTAQIIDRLQEHKLDAGILATPLSNSAIIEQPLFYEEFLLYAASKENSFKKKYVLAEDIDINELWLLEEGHCMRDQVLNLCEVRKKDLRNGNFDYQSGSLETLRKMVDANSGITILPELATHDLNARQQKNLRMFKPPVPVREISIVTYRLFVKERYIIALKEAILNKIPEHMKTSRKRNVTSIETS